MLRLQAGIEILPPGKTKEALEKALELGDQAIAEGRESIHDLRASATTTNELAQAMRGVADELAGEGSPTFRLVVEGAVRDLYPNPARRSVPHRPRGAAQCFQPLAGQPD
jgi:signal transduction histidine kinase